MSERKINLDEIIKDKWKYLEESAKILIKDIAKEACRQTLELAAKNIGFIETTSEKLNSEEYKPFITADDGTVWTIDKQSILDIINKIE